MTRRNPARLPARLQPRRVLVAAAAAAGTITCLLAVAPVHAQAGGASGYPNRPIRLIVPFPPGGGNDILARSVATRLAEIVGQQVVVDNRGGAGGLIGATTAAQATPDGYTLMLASLGNLVVNPALQAKPPYDPVRDYAPVTLLATSYFLAAIHPSLPAKNVQEFIALAKAKPGAMNYGSSGVGSSVHLTGEMFRFLAGIDIVHIAYKGTGPALTDLIGGQVQLVIPPYPSVIGHVRGGRLRALGVSGPKRVASAPDIPTIAEAGVPGYEVVNWQGIVLPARTPVAIVQKLNRDLHAAMKIPGMSESLSAQGLDPVTGTPESFGALIKSEAPKYRDLIKRAGIKAD